MSSKSSSECNASWFEHVFRSAEERMNGESTHNQTHTETGTEANVDVRDQGSEENEADDLSVSSGEDDSSNYSESSSGSDSESSLESDSSYEAPRRKRSKKETQTNAKNSVQVETPIERALPIVQKSSFSNQKATICAFSKSEKVYIHQYLRDYLRFSCSDNLSVLWRQLGIELGHQVADFRYFVPYNVRLRRPAGQSYQVCVPKFLFQKTHDHYIKTQTESNAGNGEGLWDKLAQGLRCTTFEVMQRWSEITPLQKQYIAIINGVNKRESRCSLNPAQVEAYNRCVIEWNNNAPKYKKVVHVQQFYAYLCRVTTIDASVVFHLGAKTSFDDKTFVPLITDANVRAFTAAEDNALISEAYKCWQAWGRVHWSRVSVALNKAERTLWLRWLHCIRSDVYRLYRYVRDTCTISSTRSGNGHSSSGNDSRTVVGFNYDHGDVACVECVHTMVQAIELSAVADHCIPLVNTSNYVLHTIATTLQSTVDSVVLRVDEETLTYVLKQVQWYNNTTTILAPKRFWKQIAAHFNRNSYPSSSVARCENSGIFTHKSVASSWHQLCTAYPSKYCVFQPKSISNMNAVVYFAVRESEVCPFDVSFYTRSTWWYIHLYRKPIDVYFACSLLSQKKKESDVDAQRAPIDSVDAVMMDILLTVKLTIEVDDLVSSQSHPDNLNTKAHTDPTTTAEMFLPPVLLPGAVEALILTPPLPLPLSSVSKIDRLITKTVFYWPQHTAARWKRLADACKCSVLFVQSRYKHIVEARSKTKTASTNCITNSVVSAGSGDQVVSGDASVVLCNDDTGLGSESDERDLTDDTAADTFIPPVLLPGAVEALVLTPPLPLPLSCVSKIDRLITKTVFYWPQHTAARWERLADACKCSVLFVQSRYKHIVEARSKTKTATTDCITNSVVSAGSGDQVVSGDACVVSYYEDNLADSGLGNVSDECDLTSDIREGTVDLAAPTTAGNLLQSTPCVMLSSANLVQPTNCDYFHDAADSEDNYW